MGVLEEHVAAITNEDVYDAFESGRGLMLGCDVRPETLEDEPETRTEWHRGNVAKTLFCQGSTETIEECAVKSWQHLVNLNG